MGLFNSAVLIFGVGGVLAMLAQGATSVVGNAFSDPEPVEMNNVRLSYEGGMFHQQIAVSGRDQIRASWAAKVQRGAEIICAGGGISTYEGGKTTMTPDIWTGDDCPTLQDGDTAFASWEWKGENGAIGSVSKQITIGGKPGD